MRSLLLLTFALCLLAILKQGHAVNQSAANQRWSRWSYTDDDTEFYDDDEEYGQSASNYMSMKVPKPTNVQPIKYQPILLVPDQPPAQPVQNLIVTKVTPAPVKPQYNGKLSYHKSPYDTPPGSFTPQSYGGHSNYGKKSRGPIDLYNSYLSSNSYQQYNQYCTKAYGQKPIITAKDLDQAFRYALNEVQGYAKMEVSIGNQGGYANVSGPYTSTARHQISTYLTKLSPKAFKEKEALIMEFATKYLNKYKCLSKYDTHFLLPSVKVKERPMKDVTCNYAFSHNAGQKAVDCSKAAKSKYRTPEGICNNLMHPYWGKANVCHLRLVASAYEDGVSAPRTYSYKYGQKLPSPRMLSNSVHYDRPDRFFYTSAVMSFGQFLNHDISFTPQTKPEYKGAVIDCCKKTPGYKGAAYKLHPQCFPVELDANDYQAKNYGKNCMSFVRSAPCPLCQLGPREQINTVTSFLDLSVTYGSSQEQQHKLRAHVKGLLRTSKNKYGNILLPQSEGDDQCSSRSNSHYCFLAGDTRGNQHPLLQVFHLIFLRNHNLHALNLAKVNPLWSDEMLFQEAKRLNIAQYQHIIYEEYLPLIFGPTLSSYYNLNADGYEAYSKYEYKSKLAHYRKNLFTIYEPRTDPTSWNDYATTACRYGHSQISSFFSLIGGIAYNGANYTGAPKAPGFWLRDVFFSSSLLHEGQLDAIVKGLVTDRSMLVDPHFSNDIKNYLYISKNEKVGSDLVSINIQRARDHALPGYTTYVEFCFGEKIASFDGLKKFIPVETIANLKKVYADVRDIDFYTGGISERKFPDASVGPTFACVLGIQYYHLKFGDRYFYSHGYQAGSFTPDQLLNIKEASSFSSLICKTGDYIRSIQINPFLPISKYNYEVPCNSLPAINYNLFKAKY